MSVASSGPSRRMLFAAAILCAGVAIALGWKHCGASQEHHADDALTIPVDEPVVPVPQGLLAEITIGTPNASWGRLQRGIGGALGILPSSAGGILCLGVGLDPVLASEIDGVAPAFGVVAGDPTSPRWVFAVKLVDLRKARGTLVDGDTARFSSKEIGGVTELLAKGNANPLPAVVAISPNGYLLVAHAEEDLAPLVPWVTRALPRRPLPVTGAVVVDVPHDALGSLVKPKLDELWAGVRGYLLAEDERMRRTHGGRAPDYGDPKAIVAALDGWVSRRIAIVADLDRLKITADLADDGISIVTTMVPPVKGGPSATWTETMVVGDLAPLGALPSTSAIAVLVRDNEADRRAQAEGLEALAASALGARLAESDTRKLHAVVEDYQKARAEALTAALIWDEPQGLLLRAPVRDSAAASHAVSGALDLVRTAPFKDWLRARDVTTHTEDAPGLGTISLSTIARTPSPVRDRREGRDAGENPPPKDELGLGWVVDDTTLSLASGELPAVTLGAAVHPSRRLGDEPALARSLAALAAGTNSVLVAQPLRFDPMRANLPVAPLVVALGKNEKTAVLRIDVANGLLRELSRSFLGL